MVFIVQRPWGAGRKKRVKYDESALLNVEALEEEDEVQEGIDWSGSEGDSGDESE